MAIEQAMAAGKAVLCTAVGGVPFLIEHGRTGILVEPDSPEAIADALVRLNEHPALRQRIGMAARQEARQRFEVNAVAAKTRTVYERVFQDSSP
jgi:glycosyltransferase involved in cell wall biosynthesis